MMDWEKVKDQVEYFMTTGFISFQPPEIIGATSLEQVVQKTRPAFELESGPDYVNFYAQWLYCWLTAINATRARAAALTHAGFRPLRGAFHDDACKRYRYIGAIYGADTNPGPIHLVVLGSRHADQL